MDGLPQATRAAALAVRVGTWLRDEDATLPNPAMDVYQQRRPVTSARDQADMEPSSLLFDCPAHGRTSSTLQVAMRSAFARIATHTAYADIIKAC